LPGAHDAVRALEAADRKTALRALLELASECDIGAWNSELTRAAVDAGLPAADIEAYRTVVREFPMDWGVPATVLLAVVSLEPGDAVYVPAGVPHSYIRGVGLEVMTSSDNVLRLGLTGKPIHVDEAFRCLDWSTAPVVIRGSDHFAPAGAPFMVDLVQTVSADSGRYRLVVAIDGEAHVAGPAGGIDLVPGEAMALLSGDPGVEVTTSGRAAVVRATL
jgi:mannose-6-phosphate isomerase